MNLDIEIPIITGPDLFQIAVIGSDENSLNLITVVKDHRRDDGDMNVRAHLKIEPYGSPDEIAVSVYVESLLVGHLTIATANEFKQAVNAAELTEFSIFECRARISRSAGYVDDRSRYCIWLDLPQDTDHIQQAECTIRQIDESLVRAYRKGAVADRQIDELIGIVKGVLADGVVTQGEVNFLFQWMEANRQAANLWPAKALYPRLAHAAAKGSMSLNEEREMLVLLMKTIGGNDVQDLGFQNKSSALPLTEPLLSLTFEGQAFCFTGVFHSGTRNWCHSQIADRHGRSIGNITKNLNYLVIGDIGNEAWAHSTHGRKIEKAIEYNEAGSRIAIISEEHWYSHL